MNNNETYILLFDGICNLCNSIVKFTIKRDTKGKFKFAAFQSDEGKTLLKELGLKSNYFDSLVLIIGDKYYLKSSAGLLVLKELGSIWKMGYVFIYFPRPLRDFVYNLIAKTRYRIFGKQNVCMVPTNDIKQRFL